jgi:uncharacterized protein (TIGR02594 family)
MRTLLATIFAAFFLLNVNTTAHARPSQQQNSYQPFWSWNDAPIVKRHKATKHRSARRRVHRARRVARSHRRHVRVQRRVHAVQVSRRHGVPVVRAVAADGGTLIGSIVSAGSGAVDMARRYLGMTASQLGLPHSLWCADFANMIERKAGRKGTGSRMASSFAGYGRRVSGPTVGAYAVLSRGRRGGHVGIVSGVDARGNPIIISGNHGRRVAESVYPSGRVYAYVLP